MTGGDETMAGSAAAGSFSDSELVEKTRHIMTPMTAAMTTTAATAPPATARMNVRLSVEQKQYK